MKILIGTPVHEFKDYSMERWLKNVSEISTPFDLLLVDNSPDSNYLKKLDGYCKKFTIKNYVIKHIDIDQNLGTSTRIELSFETIRRYVLAYNYDSWFSWECDQIIPANSLEKLIRIMDEGNYMMVVHNSKARWNPDIKNSNMGLTLIRRNCLVKNYFLPTKNGKISILKKDLYNINNPNIYKNRVIKNGGNYIEIDGVISPVYHLDH